MEDYALLRALVFVWLAALAFGYLWVRMRMPLTVGYMVSGLLIGPHGLKLVSDPRQIHELAEIGVALLLFALGMEVSLRTILRSPKKIICVGVGQMLLTTGLSWLLAQAAGITATAGESFLFACACALSSTVVVTKILTDRGEADALHGRLLILVLIIQDLSLVPIISLMEAFKNPSGVMLVPLVLSVLKGVLFVAGLFFVAMRIIPVVLTGVTKVNSRELFFLTVICLCLGIAALTQYGGFSLALGAFLAGITMTESPYGHQALADMLPMRDLFAAVFFVSIGLLLDPVYILEHGQEVFLFVVLLIVGKTVIAAICAYPVYPGLWTSILFGVGLAQIGEFSFVLASLGHHLGIIHERAYNLLFAGSAVTLLISPALMSAMPSILKRVFVARSDLLLHQPGAQMAAAGVPEKLRDHIIICGFGRMGRNLGRVFAGHNLPFLVIDLNASALEELVHQGVPKIYGDVFNKHVLEAANIAEAACLVVTVPDPLAVLGTINIVRESRKDLPIIARGHRSEDIEIFRAAGANAVVQPEYEASVEIARLSLLAIRRSGQEIREALSDIHKHRYSVFKPEIDESASTPVLETFGQEHFGVWFYVDAENRFTGKSIQELDVRNKTGVLITAIKRDRLIAYPSPSETFDVGDEIYVVGSHQQLQDFESAFEFSRFCPFSEVTSDEISTTPQA